MLLLTILAIFYLSVTDGDLIIGPANVVVLNNTKVQLNCTMKIDGGTTGSSVLQWEIWDENSSDFTILTWTYIGNIYTSNSFIIYQVRNESINKYFVAGYNISSGIFNLGINSSSMTTAGKYRCSRPIPSIISRTSEVIVLESDPVCNYSQKYSERDLNQITMSCVVKYHGHFAPIMQWSILGGLRLSSNDVTYDGEVSSTLSLNTTSQMDGQQFNCITYFNFSQSNSTLDGSAMNIPNYIYNWTSNSTKAFVSTQNISISPDQILYNPGDTITCSASGYPAPEYQWEDLNDGSLVNSSQLVINESMVGENLTYQCTAWNVIQGKFYHSSINQKFSVPCSEFCTITSSGNEFTCSIPYGRNYSWYSGSTWLHFGRIYITTNISNISCSAVVNDNCSPIRCTNVSIVAESTSSLTINGGDNGPSVLGAVVGGVAGGLVVVAIILIVIYLLRRKKCLQNNEREKSNGREEIIPYSRHTLLVEDRNDERERQGEETSENIPNIPNYTQVDKFQKKKKPSSEQPPDLITNTQDQYAEIGTNLGMKNQGYEDVGMEVIKPKPKQIVGEDGTVYQDLNLSKPAASKPGAPKPKPAAPAVIGDTTGNYASIDHLQNRQ